jgi:hypothetical protein
MSAQPGARLLRAGLLQALTTFDVYKPLSRKGPLSPLVFFSSWPVSELPIQTAFAEVALAAGLVRSQDLRSRRGQLGLALTAASVAGLVGVRRAADRVEGELELHWLTRSARSTGRRSAVPPGRSRRRAR